MSLSGGNSVGGEHSGLIGVPVPLFTGIGVYCLPISGHWIKALFILLLEGKTDSNGLTSWSDLDPPKSVSTFGTNFAGWINNSHLCLRYFSGLWKRTAEGEGCQSSPQSVTPPQPQPPIKLRGSPLCGHSMLVCKMMIKLEATMFYFQFYDHS